MFDLHGNCCSIVMYKYIERDQMHLLSKILLQYNGIERFSWWEIWICLLFLLLIQSEEHYVITKPVVLKISKFCPQLGLGVLLLGNICSQKYNREDSCHICIAGISSYTLSCDIYISFLAYTKNLTNASKVSSKKNWYIIMLITTWMVISCVYTHIRLCTPPTHPFTKSLTPAPPTHSLARTCSPMHIEGHKHTSTQTHMVIKRQAWHPSALDKQTSSEPVSRKNNLGTHLHLGLQTLISNEDDSLVSGFRSGRKLAKTRWGNVFAVGSIRPVYWRELFAGCQRRWNRLPVNLVHEKQSGRENLHDVCSCLHISLSSCHLL